MSELIVYAAGGAMAGVYSAGVLDALAELGVRDKVTAIYGISAGAFNAANFATRTTARSLSWYADHVPSNDIIKSKNPIVAFRGRKLIDSEKAMSIMKEENLMNINSLILCDTPVYFGVVDFATKEFVWKDARRSDAITLLKATTTLVPFSNDPVELDGARYVDGGYVETVALASLRARHPGARFIIILNTHFEEFMIKRLVAHIMIRLHDASLAESLSKSLELAVKELAEAEKAKDVMLFRPGKDFPVDVLTTDVELVRKGFKLGIDSVEKRTPELVKFLNTNILN